MSSIKKNSDSFIVNALAFSTNIDSLSKKIVKILNKPKSLIKFNLSNKDHRNYNVGSKNFRRYFKSFKFTKIEKDLRKLINQIRIKGFKPNAKTVRVKFYKKN